MSKKQPGSFTNLLTIAIPVYERKEYFKEALESALNQTIKCKVIVVDNCSSHDFFEKICIEKGITYFRNESNIGLFPNQNRCYSHAQTEYVKVLDSDDLLSPKYVESFLRAKEMHSDIDVFFTDYVILTSDRESSHQDAIPFGYMENGNKIIDYGIKYRLAFPYMSSTIKKIKAELDLDINVCKGGYDWVWVYSKADHLSFYGEPGKYHKYRSHNAKDSRKDWSANLLTVPYIYEIILSKKISDPNLLKRISKKIFWELIGLKSCSNNKELNILINSDNRFGKYLKEKLNKNILLKTIFMLPKLLIKIVFMPIKIINWFYRHFISVY